MRKGLRRTLIAIAALVVLPVAIPMAYIEGTCRPAAPASAASSAAPARAYPAIEDPNYRRKLANTFFTFPEWYIVYSFEDFGRFLDKGNESGFGYLSHIFGFWRSFCTINRAVPDTGESKFDVKSMIYVIGVSYSAEYAIKGFYENTIGRLTEWIRGPERTRQDVYARTVVQDYAQFLYTVPWYKYAFRRVLDGLTALSAPPDESWANWTRRRERNFALGTEYFVKIGYAWAIQKLLDASGPEEARDIMLVVATLPPDVLAREPRIKPVRVLSPQWQLVQVPRYKDFTEIVGKLLDGGHAIAEIAGNDAIMITVIAKANTRFDMKNTTELFSVEIDSLPGERRFGLKTGIADLVEINRQIKATGSRIEHFYDY